MKTICCTFLAAGALAALAPAQCASLAITGAGTPGTTLQVAIDGTAPNVMAFLMVSTTQGSTVLPLGPLGSLTLGLAQPLVPLPLGMTNAAGDVSRSLAVPSSTTFGIDLYGQGVTFGFSFTPPTGGGLPSFGLTTCATNVVAFHVGV